MLTLNINGRQVRADAPDDTPLLWVLRDYHGMTGTKFSCGAGLCGACMVHVDGQPMLSCITRAAAVAGKKIVTVERIGQSRTGKAVQAAWVAENVPQCGFCQSGQVMAATALLESNPAPSDADIDAAMSGNICRCATYPRIRAAIKRAAKEAGA